MSTPTPTPAPTPPISPAPPGCGVSPQAPPSGDVPADYAVALAFAPDGRLFWAGRAGTVRVWQDGGPHVFATVPTVTTEQDGSFSERGLLGLAISPSFMIDRFVYAFYSDANYLDEHVIRWRDCRGTATEPTVIVTIPAGSGCCNKGGRIAFGTDGMLYVTVGDEREASAAQQTDSPLGKILRYEADGTIPPDDPFGASNPVWAYGFRDPFGLAFSATGQLSVTDNGPSGEAVGLPRTGYDTLDLKVSRGQGRLWAVCYGLRHAVAPASACPSGQPSPDWSSESTTVVPTGGTWVDSRGPAPYANRFVFCTFNDGMRIVNSGSKTTVSVGPTACRLDVKEGPDYALYFSDPTHITRLG